MMTDAIAKMSEMLHVSLDANRAATQIQRDVSVLSIDAQHRQTLADLEISERDVKWEISTYIPLTQYLASISGMLQQQYEGLSMGESILSGASSGASIGAKIAGPKGAAVGSVVGSIAGAVSHG